MTSSAAGRSRPIRASHRLPPETGEFSDRPRFLGFYFGACLLAIAAFPRAAGADPLMNPANGHFYEAVAVTSGLTWNKANEAANARMFQGMHGHLATITSPAESTFIIKHFPLAVTRYYCLGGVQSHGLLDPAAGWQWVTGEPWSYTNWHVLNGTEPNDLYGLGTGPNDENKLQFWNQSDGSWNDIRPTSTESYGYVVEYEPDPSADPPMITGYAADQSGAAAPASTPPTSAAPTSAPPGSLLHVMGTNLGPIGTVLFDGDPLPAAIATWSPNEIRLWVPTAPSYPFQTHVIVISDRQQADGGDLTITAPTPGQDNLLANGSFEYPSSAGSPYDYGYTYGQPFDPTYPGFHGYSIPGWRIPFGTIDVYRTGWQPAPGQGKQSIDLVGSPYPGIIEQTFFTQKGKTYVFSGYFSHNYGIAYARALVYVGQGYWSQTAQQIIYSTGGNTPSNMHWTHVSFSFEAPATQTTLTIQDVTGLNLYQGMALDGLKVTPTSN